ncbi:hypothetical protein KBD45_03760 [Candidatus Dojkabacteria bacterium]|nr:hypothetical protein [Candidatus Dojkabacteria bacterium]
MYTVKKYITKTILIFCAFFFLLQIFATYFLIREISLNIIRNELYEYSDRIINDIRYENGKWNTSKYNADPLTPLPNQSGIEPLYVVANDGFVIERSSPINGLLDTSNFEKLSQFIENPQNVNTITNENWRILSKKIIIDGDELGLVTVAYFNPNKGNEKDIDLILQKDIELIDGVIKVTDGKLDVSDLDIRNTHYDAAFEIITKYNKVLINNGRIPTFIDPSYVKAEEQNKGIRLIKDTQNFEEYLLISREINDEENNQVGILVYGKSIEPINKISSTFLQYYLAANVFLSIPIFIIIVYILVGTTKMKMGDELKMKESNDLVLKSLSFDQKNSVIIINNNKFEIAYDSNQYYLCKVCFRKPSKKVDQDIIFEEFGESFGHHNSRKIYDAALAINKKTGYKIIVYQNKAYRINPLYVSLIKSQSV